MPDTALVLSDPRTATPASLVNFFRALDLAPGQANGFGPADVKRVERYWQIIDGDWLSFGYVVELHDGRRAHLQYHFGEDDDGAELAEKVEILPMQPEWWYPPISGGGVHWIEDAAHINSRLSA